MPHAELRYSDDLEIDSGQILADIEQIVLRHDADAGECKGRAYPAEIFHHTHMLVVVSLLAKPHRGAAFVAALTEDLEREVKASLPKGCPFSLDIQFRSQTYITN